MANKLPDGNLPLWEYTVPSPPTGMRRVFKILLYLIGIFVAECMLLGISFTIFGTTFGTSISRFNCISVIIAFGTLSGSLIYFFRTQYKAPCLPWLQYLWWIIGTTTGAIIAFILEATFVPHNSDAQLPTAIFGGIILLYSLSLAGVAHLQPSLRQKINESVRQILKTMPGMQLPLSDLIAFLQGEYLLSQATLDQHIRALRYLELIEISGTSIKICHIKGKKDPLTFSQARDVINHDLRQKILRALSFLDEENVDIGLFLLGKEFEATLKTYLLTANAKDKIPIPAKTPSERWKLDQMINWVRNNGIIMDHAVLNYLRQTRNDRAHGGAPSLTEKRMLMLNIQYLANLYIDYIKLFDELTRNL